ncbi:MAG: hypothetical protein HC888_02020 [Candidatus Competibacteraceae bacterium]|nr:hypothetical protein [Candidatus Competibacteraceae bacterium]
MSDTARNIEHLHPASTDGFADLFDSPDQTLLTEQGDPDQPPITTLINPDHWTLHEAAEKLQVSLVTVRRRLQRGALKGYKTQGMNGVEWRIYPPDQTLITDPDQTLVTEQGDPDQTLISTLINPDHQVLTALLARITEVESKLSEAQNALQSANWRNGYLESQLENQRDQIKLLTDSQHKLSWWELLKQFWLKR